MKEEIIRTTEFLKKKHAEEMYDLRKKKDERINELIAENERLRIELRAENDQLVEEIGFLAKENEEFKRGATKTENDQKDIEIFRLSEFIDELKTKMGDAERQLKLVEDEMIRYKVENSVLIEENMKLKDYLEGVRRAEVESMRSTNEHLREMLNKEISRKYPKPVAISEIKIIRENAKEENVDISDLIKRYQKVVKK